MTDPNTLPLEEEPQPEPSPRVERTAERRIVSFAVSGMPDLPVHSGTRNIVPDRIEITYEWRRPADRAGWYEQGCTLAKVTGHFRLKSGGVGTGEATADFWRRSDRPDWLTRVIAEHMPEGWDR